MAITQEVCNSFKVELLQGIHNFLAAGDTFKVALYLNAATLNKTTTVYSASNESSGTGYTAGGEDLTSTDPALDNDVAVCDFADVQWTGASFTARGCLIYNSSKANRAVAPYDFGSDKVVSNGTFSLVFPAADESNAIMRIG